MPPAAKNAPQAEVNDTKKPVEESAPKTKPTRFQGAICPAHDAHSARVYKTDGRTRYCKCNDCGETWKQTGEYADPLRALCADLVKQLEESEPVTIEAGTPKVILFDAEDAASLAKQLREFLPL